MELCEKSVVRGEIKRLSLFLIRR